MRFLNTISEWITVNQEKRISKMRSQGKCPECSGNGYNPMVINEFLYASAYEDFKCPSCNGSGLFSDWNEARQQIQG